MIHRVTKAFLALAIGFLGNAALAAGPDPDRYIVSFQDDAKGRSALAASGAQVLRELPGQGAVAARIPSRALKGLQRNPNIEYIEVDAVRYPMSQTIPWGIPAIQADTFADLVTDTPKICIIDSGYSNGHEDLPNLSAADVTPNAGTGDPLAPASLCHHGTHVAGTIAAVAENGLGIVGVAGINKDNVVNLHIVKVFEDDPSSPSGCGWGYSSDLVAALDACVAAESKIINMSLGGPVKSRTEQRAFAGAYNSGVLSIAAAGNDGNTRHSYPASYDSVISVAAVDSAKVVADFSQQTSQVELAAPGVAVRSTVTMGTGADEILVVGLDDDGFEATAMEGSPNTSSGSWPLFLCNSVDGLGSPSDCVGATDSICLISRGDITFAEKVQECAASGGKGAVIFNNSAALFSGTLGGVAVGIPAVGVSGVDGDVLKARAGETATVTTTTGGHYAFYDGTSMATPHVVGAAALVWGQAEAQGLNCTNDDIRAALDATADDKGPAGRDTAYGYGLVQAADALAFLDCGGGGTPPGECPLLPAGATCSSDSQCCSNTCKGKPNNKTCK
jgi:subtilisin family serine protease